MLSNAKPKAWATNCSPPRPPEVRARRTDDRSPTPLGTRTTDTPHARSSSMGERGLCAQRPHPRLVLDVKPRQSSLGFITLSRGPAPAGAPQRPSVPTGAAADRAGRHLRKRPFGGRPIEWWCAKGFWSPASRKHLGLRNYPKTPINHHQSRQIGDGFSVFG